MSFTHNGLGEMTLGAEDRVAAIAEVKAALKLVGDADNALIAAFAEIALGLAERFLGRVLIVRAMTERLAASTAWQSLGAVPVMSITGVSAIDGETSVPLTIEDYAIDLDAEAQGWIRITAPGVTMVDIAYHAGWVGGWAMIPAPVRQGAVLLAAYLYDARDGSAPPPAAVTALWRPYRAVALDRAVRA